MKLNDAKPEDTYKQVLVLGRSGSGKSSLLRSAPQPCFVADFDCKGLDIFAGCDGDLEMYDGPESWANFLKKIDEFEKDCPYKSIHLDSLSLGGDTIVEWAKKQNGNSSFRVAPEDWGRAIGEVKRTVRRLKKLPANIFVTMHFNVDKDEHLGGLIWEPAIFGAKLPGQLPAFFNDVWLLKVVSKMENGKPTSTRHLQLVPDQRFDMLKNSGKGAWAAEEQPDITALFNKLKRN